MKINVEVPKAKQTKNKFKSIALLKFEITEIIHKKNLSKSQLIEILEYLSAI